MAALLAAVALGIILAVFANQNTGVVTLYFGSQTLPDVPLFLAILIPILLALVLAFLVHLARDLSQKLTISEQKDQIKRFKAEIAEISKAAHKLQLENNKLKSENGQKVDEDAF